MGDGFLPYGRQQISDADVEAVVDVLRSDFITQGPRVEEFERAMAEELSATHAVAFSSGTAALHGAAAAAELGPGDALITSPISFVASANCALYMGASPRFGDIDPDTLNLDCAAVTEAAGPEVKAVVPVSFAGLPVDLEPLGPLRDRVVVIEDACHAIGARRPSGAVGGPGGADMTCFSFHPVKTMTTGEGGLVTTESDEFAERLRTFRTHGVIRDNLSPHPNEGGWYYEVQSLGFNYRITDLQCALGLSQLGRLNAWVERRNEVAGLYRLKLADEDRVILPPEPGPDSVHAYHLFVIRVRDGAETRLRVFESLRAAGIGVQVHYIPIYRFPYYRDLVGTASCPQADRYYDCAISLPIFPAMDESDVDRVVTELRSAL